MRALDSAPWLAAWAPGGGEAVFGKGTGKFVAKGSRVILQVHYNLREGTEPDTTAVRLRLAAPGADLEALQTMLLVAPVELPCLPEESGPLCDRVGRGQRPGHAGSGPTPGAPWPGSSCCAAAASSAPRAGRDPALRPPGRPQDMQVRAVAGHMHLLGRSISVTLDPGGPRERTPAEAAGLGLRRPGRRPCCERPVQVRAGDTLRVTCRHDAALRGMIPELENEQPRYVTWGEGTSDEMCLGIVMYTAT